MSKYQYIRNIVFRVTTVSLLATLAACGGSDESQNQASCLDNIIILLICSAASTGSDAPVQAPVSTSGSGVTGMATNSASADIVQVDEYEPNNILDNANIISLSGGFADDAQGVQFNGQVQSNDDATDHFVFTPHQSGTYRIYLCADTCNDSLEDDAAYIMVYDQNQTTIAATPVGTVVQQEIEADLTAGLAYYVEVNGYNATADNYEYRLVVSN